MSELSLCPMSQSVLTTAILQSFVCAALFPLNVQEKEIMKCPLGRNTAVTAKHETVMLIDRNSLMDQTAISTHWLLANEPTCKQIWAWFNYDSWPNMLLLI